MKRFLLVFGVICALGAAPVLAQEAEGGEAEKEPTWKGSLGLSWVATSGNTDTSSADRNSKTQAGFRCALSINPAYA